MSLQISKNDIHLISCPEVATSQSQGLVCLFRAPVEMLWCIMGNAAQGVDGKGSF